MDRPSEAFPKSARILRRSDFRRVYDHGTRAQCAYFAAFCLAETGRTGSGTEPELAPSRRVGFTVPRAVGKSVVRNRIRRKLREAVRRRLHLLPPGWSIVFNPRRAVLEAPAQALEREVEKLFLRCGNS